MMAATAISSGHGSHDAIFDSVFQAKTYTTPTPEATPNIGTLASPGVSFGGVDVQSTPSNDVIRLSRAWSQATRFLSIQSTETLSTKKIRDDPAVSEAIDLLLSAPSSRKELLDWYLHMVQNHFRHHALPQLSFWKAAVAIADAANALSQSIKILKHVQSAYFAPFAVRRRRITPLDDRIAAFDAHLRQEYHAFVLQQLPRSRIQKTISSLLFLDMSNALNESSTVSNCQMLGHCYCGVDMDVSLLAQLQTVGLGGELGERAVAYAVHRLIEDAAVNRPCFRVDWTSRDTVMTRVRDWIDRKLVPAVRAALNALAVEDTNVEFPQSQLMAMAINSFGRSRVECLLDYIKAWPASRGAVRDIKEYLTTNGSAHKVQLCAVFSEQVKSRILHAGVSTSEILGVYMSVINVFNMLDPRKVLFERVSTPIRNYLRNRDDTVKIVAASFLFDNEASDDLATRVDYEKVCIDLAAEIAALEVRPQTTTSLNFNDMAWTPEPLDSALNLRSVRSDDLITSILALFDPDDFAQAFHSTLGQHLLMVKNVELIKETKLIEILKDRLDSAKLQAYEVMMKDMRDSEILNKRARPQITRQEVTMQEFQAAIPTDGISFDELWVMFKHRINHAQFMSFLPHTTRRWGEIYYPKRTRQRQKDQPEQNTAPLEINARITSRHYWPTRRRTEQAPPPQVLKALDDHERRFTALSGGQRRIDWDHAAGRMSISLELEDRKVDFVDVETHRAVVLDAFALDRQPTADALPIEYDPATGLSIADLVSALEMPEDRVVDGVNHWLAQRILYQISAGRFAVLERLDMEDKMDLEDADPTLMGAGAAGMVDAPAESMHDAMLREQAPLYQAFIVNMLRNSGSKQVDGMMGITAVLKMMIQDFPFGDDEVRWLLSDMAGRGEVKKDGEIWSAG